MADTNGRDLNVRQRLANAAADEYKLIRDTLLEVAKATKTVWHSCHHCGKRDQVEVPDAHAACKAIELLLNQGYGRPKETAGDSGDFVFVRKVVLPRLPPSLQRLLDAVTDGDRPELREAAAAVETELARGEEMLVSEETHRSSAL